MKTANQPDDLLGLERSRRKGTHAGDQTVTELSAVEGQDTAKYQAFLEKYAPSREAPAVSTLADKIRVMRGFACGTEHGTLFLGKPETASDPAGKVAVTVAYHFVHDPDETSGKSWGNLNANFVLHSDGTLIQTPNTVYKCGLKQGSTTANELHSVVTQDIPFNIKQVVEAAFLTYCQEISSGLRIMPIIPLFDGATDLEATARREQVIRRILKAQLLDQTITQAREKLDPNEPRFYGKNLENFVGLVHVISGMQYEDIWTSQIEENFQRYLRQGNVPALGENSGALSTNQHEALVEFLTRNPSIPIVEMTWGDHFQNGCQDASLYAVRARRSS